MRYVIITPPHLSQPHRHDALIVPAVPAQYNDVLNDHVRPGDVALIVNDVLQADWRRRLTDADYCQDGVDSYPIAFKVPLRFDPRMAVHVDLALQAKACGYQAAATGLQHNAATPDLRDLRYVHYKWARRFPAVAGSTWKWDELGLSVQLRDAWVTVHSAETADDHLLGMI